MSPGIFGHPPLAQASRVPGLQYVQMASRAFPSPGACPSPKACWGPDLCVGGAAVRGVQDTEGTHFPPA